MQTHVKTFGVLAVVLVAVFACTSVSEPKKSLDGIVDSTTKIKIDKEQRVGTGGTFESEPKDDISQDMKPAPNVDAESGIILPPKVELCPKVIPSPSDDGKLPKDFYQCAAPFEKLEDPLLDLLTTLTEFLKSGTKGVPTKLVDFFSPLVGIVSGIITTYATYRGLRKILCLRMKSSNSFCQVSSEVSSAY